MAVGRPHFVIFQFEAFLVRTCDHRTNVCLCDFLKPILHRLDYLSPRGKSLAIKRKRIFFRLMAQEETEKTGDAFRRKHSVPQTPFFCPVIRSKTLQAMSVAYL